MLTSLAFIFLAGLALAAICQKLRLPRILGMLATGMLLGPWMFNVLDDTILGISPDLRKLALIIILLKAGLSLNLRDLKRVGRPALLLSFLPAGFEVLAYTFIAPLIFGVSHLEGAILGAVLGAVSPAVVVPRMVQLMESGYGTDQGIPQMILAGSSMDDVFVIVLFSTFMGFAQGGTLSAGRFLEIPVSIVLGLAVGGLVGLLMAKFFEARYSHNAYIRNSGKIIILLSVAFLLVALEDGLKGIVPLSGLLAVMAMALALASREPDAVVGRLAQKLGKLWIAAEVILFVLVGAAVDIRYTLNAGFGVVAMIFLALGVRAIGVWISLAGTPLNLKERIFCVIAYLPKATVQAAIGSVPLAAGLPCGQLVLTVAVVAIIITAPLGALGMEATYRKLLRPAGKYAD